MKGARKCLPSRCVCGFCGTYGENGPPTQEQLERWRRKSEKTLARLRAER